MGTHLAKRRDVLWYIDGHHGAFENRSFPIPEVFKAFDGYNVPERSKHRKRKTGNMSYDILISHVGTSRQLDAATEVAHSSRER